MVVDEEKVRYFFLLTFTSLCHTLGDPDLVCVHACMGMCLHVCVYTGGPGSGKSSQCEQMEERLGLQHVTLAGLLCAEQQSHSDQGHLIQDILEKGDQLLEVSCIVFADYMSVCFQCLLTILLCLTHTQPVSFTSAYSVLCICPTLSSYFPLM